MAAGDDANALMARIIDKVDKILYASGMEFNDEEEDWESAIQELSAWIFKHYVDFAGSGSYRPSDASETTSDDEDLMEESVTDPEAEVDLKASE